MLFLSLNKPKHTSMKLISLALMALLAMGCGSQPMSQTTQIASPTESPQTAQARNTAQRGKTPGTFTDADRIGNIMGYLASDELQGRDSGSEGIAKAARFIEEHFRANGVKPYYGSYRDTLSNFTPPAYNIVGLVEGNDTHLKHEYIVIRVHYDHIGLG